MVVANWDTIKQILKLAGYKLIKCTQYKIPWVPSHGCREQNSNIFLINTFCIVFVKTIKMFLFGNFIKNTFGLIFNHKKIIKKY